MQLIDGRRVHSATDLVGFLACRHLTQLEIRASAGEIERVFRDNPLADLLAKRGDEHEQAHLRSLREARLEVVSVERPENTLAGLAKAEADTLEAMRQGVDVVYQATFFDGRWRGHADFLVRTTSPSDLGDYSYEVHDTKLARRAKASAIIQLCSYSYQLTRLQGLAPEHMRLVLGDKTVESFALRDYESYFRTTKALFEATMEAGPHETYPEPVDHCRVCRWLALCAPRRRADDHLSLVAGIRKDQTKKLVTRGVGTAADLAAWDPSTRVKGIAPTTLERIQDQAAMQVEKRTTHRIAYKILPPSGPNLGLEALPEPGGWDLFFDIESDEYAEIGGLEYLFGLIDIHFGQETYSSWWSHDQPTEKETFEAFIDLVTERFKAHPELHIYHYGAYEKAALKRLMNRYATREDELDRLLRAGVFVDLLRVVKQGVRISEESYSIKALEPFYMPPRTDAITDASSSLVEYERYLDSGDPKILDDIEEYNRVDCASLVGLRDWLNRLRVEAEKTMGIELSRPPLETGDADAGLQDALSEIEELVDTLTGDVPVQPEERTDEQQARWLLAQLLGWHRREAKSGWWFYFERLEKTNDDLIEDGDALGGLKHEAIVGEEGRSHIHRFSFPPQDHKIPLGQGSVNPRTRRGVGNIIEISDEERFLLIKKGKGREDHPVAIIPGGPYKTNEQKQALQRLGEWVRDHGIEGTGEHRAIRDLLLRSSPRIADHANGSDLRHPGETGSETACRIAGVLDDSYVPIQGPPGTGKTFTGARMIIELVQQGHRVGITATSHKVITNLLDRVCAEATSSGLRPQILQRCDEDERCASDLVTRAKDNKAFDEALLTGKFSVVAGTAWLLSREEVEGSLHTLFIDEAGQFSLADAAAVSGVANSLVLLGDPQQLAQPSQGIHPPGAEVSVLQHVLGDRKTITHDRGIFLETTWRMNPDVCAFVSEAFYEGRLESVDACAQQRLEDHGLLGPTGAFLLQVPHEGNRIRSLPEAEEIKRHVEDLLTRDWINFEGGSKRLTLEDILIVAPYNAQVGLIRELLPKGARVGTVDKFQGQEGAVTFYSMTTSTAEDIPRNFEFLYSLNRLNVAASRARAVAVVVCSPELIEVQCKTPRQMELANALCRFFEMSQRLDAAPSTGLSLHEHKGSMGLS